MNKLFIISLLLSILLVSSCGYQPSRNKSGGNQADEVSQLVICPLCNGTGIFSYMPGDFMAPKEVCSLCKGQGVCTASAAQPVIDMQREINGMMNGGNSGGYLQSGRSAYEIQYQLDRAYELLHSMEENYNNCTSGVLRAQYPSMIAEQKRLIMQLENELRNAQ